MSPLHCTHCGQILPTRRLGVRLTPLRLGVRLTPLKARIFDIIRRAGADGIMHEDLQTYVGLGKGCIKAHVYQINEAIENTGYRIYGRGSWRVMPLPKGRRRAA